MKKTLLAAALLLGALTINAQDYKHSIGANVGSFYGLTYKGFITENLAIVADLGCNLGNYGTYHTTTQKAGSNDTETTHWGSSYPAEGEKVTDNVYKMKQKYSNDYFTFELNPNLVYQMKITEFGAGSLSWFAGGGLSIGMMKSGSTNPDAYMDENGNKKNFWWAMSQRVDVPDGEGTKKEDYIDLQGKFGINAIGGVEFKLASLPLAFSLDFRPGYGLSFRSDEAETYSLTQERETVKVHTTDNFFDWKLVAAVRYCF